MKKDNSLFMDLSTNEVNILVNSSRGILEKDTVEVSGIKKGEILDQEKFNQSFDNPQFVQILNSYDFKEVIFGVSPSTICIKKEKCLIFENNHPTTITEKDLSNWTKDEGLKSYSDLFVIHSYPLGFLLEGKDIVSNPLGMHARKFEVNEVKVLIPLDLANKVSRLSEELDLNCPIYVVSNTIASCQNLVSQENKDFGCYFINVGDNVTELAAIHKGKVRYVNAIPVGNSNFINDVALALDVTAKEAQLLVDSYGTITPELIKEKEVSSLTSKSGNEIRVSNKQVGGIMRARADELLHIAKSHFEKDLSQDFIANRIVVGGKGANYKGFESLVKYIFQFFVYGFEYENDEPQCTIDSLLAISKDEASIMNALPSSGIKNNFNQLIPRGYSTMVRTTGKLTKEIIKIFNERVSSGGAK